MNLVTNGLYRNTGLGVVSTENNLKSEAGEGTAARRLAPIPPPGAGANRAGITLGNG